MSTFAACDAHIDHYAGCLICEREKKSAAFEALVSAAREVVYEESPESCTCGNTHAVCKLRAALKLAEDCK